MRSAVVNVCVLSLVAGIGTARCFGFNLVLNGSFESNSATSSQYNLSNEAWNSLVANSASFGSGPQLDLENNGQYSGGAPDGNWAAALATTTGSSNTDALSLALSENLVAGQQYTVRFLARTNTLFGTVPSVLEVGVSNSATAFGSLVFTTPTLGDTWTTFSTTFTASGGESQLTARAQVNGTWHWTWVDNFQLNAVPSGGASSTLALAGIAALRRRRAR
jgi:hypothetical protein